MALGDCRAIEIRKLQKGTEILISKLPFQRLVLEVDQDHKTGVRFLAGSMETFEHNAEAMMTEIFEEVRIAVINAKPVTIMPMDIEQTVHIFHGGCEVLKDYNPGQKSSKPN